MSRKQYVRQLEGQSGYCKCPGLEELYASRRRAEELEAIAEHFKSEADLEDPREDDLEYLKRYRDAVEQLDKASQSYYKKLDELMNDTDSGLLKLVLHNPKKRSPVGEISVDRAIELLENNTPIITAHCRRCDKQIDIAHGVCEV